jgi:hypothetical protein
MKNSMRPSNIELAFEKLVMDQPTLKADIMNYTSGFYPKLLVYTIGFGSLAVGIATFIICASTSLFFSTFTGSLVSSGLSTLWSIKRLRKSNQKLFKQAQVVRDEMVTSYSSAKIYSIDLAPSNDYLASFWLEVMVGIAIGVTIGVVMALVIHSPVFVGFGYTLGCIPSMLIKYSQYSIARRNEGDIRDFDQQARNQFNTDKMLIQLPPAQDLMS